MEHWFDSEGWNIKDGAQDGRHLVPEDLSDQKNAIQNILMLTLWYLIVSIPDLCTLTYFVWLLES